MGNWLCSEGTFVFLGGRLDGKHNVILPRRLAFLHLRSMYKVHINLPVPLTSVGGIKPNRLCVAIKYHLAVSTFCRPVSTFPQRFLLLDSLFALALGALTSGPRNAMTS